jgi:putative redox protein
MSLPEEDWFDDDRRLDEALELTFPASDPVAVFGDVGGRSHRMTTAAGGRSKDATQRRTVIVTGSAAGLAQDISIGGHRLSADEPIEGGGTDTGPNPYDLLLAALGACTSMTLALYARRKQWPLRTVTVRLRHSKIHAADCAECETREGQLDHIERDVELAGALDDDQRARLLEIANKCPVHRTLTSEIDIRTRLL